MLWRHQQFFSFSFYSFSFLQPTVEWWDCFYSSRASNTGWFHLHILVFPFVYQFNSRKGVLFSPFIIYKFQQHFSIISKFVFCGFYIKKNAAFTLISFALLKWDECLSVQLPFELPVEIPFQLHLELEVNWLVQNVNELWFELSRI